MADMDVQRRTGPIGMGRRGLPLVVLVVLTLLQAVLFYNHFATALTALFGVGLGWWMRSWTAGFWAAASFLVAFVLSAAVGHMGYFRPIADPLLGVGMAFGGGVIGGGIFDVLRRETASDRAAIAG